jgi:hypothetical protein
MRSLWDFFGIFIELIVPRFTIGEARIKQKANHRHPRELIGHFMGIVVGDSTNQHGGIVYNFMIVKWDILGYIGID